MILIRWNGLPRSSKAVFAAIVVGTLLSAGATAKAESVLIFPQLPAGGDVGASVTLTNTNFDRPVSGVFSVFNQDGSPRSIAIDGQPAGSSFRVNIPVGGSVTLTLTRGGNLTIGMGKFTSDFPAGGVVLFQLGASQIGVLSSPPQPFATLVFDTTAGNEAGLAIANAGSAPVNLSLVHSGASGEIIETVDPPELNPLPGNGQVARFLPEFGLRQTANQSSHTIRIQPKAGGKFAALGLLLRSGLLSSTAVVKGATGKFSFEEFSRAYTGTWRNTTFGSEGTAALTLTVNLAANLVVINFTLTGNIFGGSPPSGPIALSGTYNDKGFTATGNAAPFGPMTLTINSDGGLLFTANSVPSANVATFRITGSAHPDRVAGDFTVGLRPSGTATGAVVLNHSGE